MLVHQIVPMENANGRKLVESGQLCERKNGRGVDPNRNWDAHWGFKESDYDPAEEYPGAAPFRSATVNRLLQGNMFCLNYASLVSVRSHVHTTVAQAEATCDHEVCQQQQR